MKRERGKQKRTTVRETERSEKGKIQERGREREGERGGGGERERKEKNDKTIRKKDRRE